jgi:hypothetical protein
MPMGVYVPDKGAPTILSKGGVYPVLVPRNTVGSTQHLLYRRNTVVLAQHITAGLRCFYATHRGGIWFLVWLMWFGICSLTYA